MARASKYAHVVKNLPKFPGDDPGRLEILGKVRDEILATTSETFNVSAQIQSTLVQVQLEVEEITDLGKQHLGTKRNATAFASAYGTMRVVVDKLSDLKSGIQLLVDVYERMMVEQMEAEGIHSMHLDSGAGVSTFEEPQGKVIDKEAFRLWCVAPPDRCMVCGGHEDALGHQVSDEQVTPHSFEHHPFKPGGGYERQLQLWPSTMNTVVKERTLNAEPAPDGIEVYSRTIVRFTKA